MCSIIMLGLKAERGASGVVGRAQDTVEAQDIVEALRMVGRAQDAVVAQHMAEALRTVGMVEGETTIRLLLR